MSSGPRSLRLRRAFRTSVDDPAAVLLSRRSRCRGSAPRYDNFENIIARRPIGSDSSSERRRCSGAIEGHGPLYRAYLHFPFRADTCRVLHFNRAQPCARARARYPSPPIFRRARLYHLGGLHAIGDIAVYTRRGPRVLRAICRHVPRLI